MIIFPAIDIKDGKCVRLYQGDFDTVHTVANDPVQTALEFKKAGAKWIHMVDLDGAKSGQRVNSQIFFDVAKQSGLNIELGGGIRDMETLEYYISGGIARCILGSAALKDPSFVKQAVKEYKDKIAVGIDAKDGKVAAEAWVEVSDVDYIDMAKQMQDIGVATIIFTDISTDGTLEGPNYNQLDQLQKAVSCDIIASGGVRDITHINKLAQKNLYGTICGKSIYSGTLDLSSAIIAANTDLLFKKSQLIPAIIQQYNTGDVLMLGYVNQQSLEKTLETQKTWFWSRSRNQLWNKGETSGHFQNVKSIVADCDNDTLLIKVDQIENACHTGQYSCFYKEIYRKES